jgi:hypothetical protein
MMVVLVMVQLLLGLCLRMKVRSGNLLHLALKLLLLLLNVSHCDSSLSIVLSSFQNIHTPDKRRK